LKNITKEINGKKRYFLANTNSQNISTSVILKGKFKPEIWNPHTGIIKKINYKTDNGYIIVNLQLEPYSSLFIIEP